ncbi:MAG: serine/threonine-protein kinase [Planctomycetaceae bacterium]
MSRTDVRGFALDETMHAWTVLADRVESFLRAWENAPEPPALGGFLPDDPPAVRRLTLVELIKVDLECRWRGRRAPRTLEEYLAEFPELAADLPADLVYEEFHVRRQAGDAVQAAHYLARFPAIARELERLLDWGRAECSTALVGSKLAKALAQFEPGDRIDDFDLLARLGQGAFASVFLARQNSMQRLVALKISADRGNEPQTLAQLDHDQIVRVYDQRVLPDRGVRLLYMQYIAGGTLARVIDAVRQTPETERTGRLLFDAVDKALDERGELRPAESAMRERISGAPWPEAVCWLGARLARGLDYAHRQGVLHRDVKPANVLLTADGSPKLADFNISFSANVAGAAPTAYFGGSLAYMSPEQLQACNPAHDRTPDSLDGKSDLYSLGVILWELLTGARPFLDEPVKGGWGPTLTDMAARRRTGIDAERLAAVARSWPAGLDQILLRCLAADPGQRYATGGELARHLELCLQPQARRLLAPPVRDWRRAARSHGLAWVIVAAMVPNLLAAIFNYFYNRVEIVSHLHGAQEFFWRTQMIINSIAFPLGLGAAGLLAWPVTRAVRPAGSAAELSAETLRHLRRRCLNLGHFAAGISLLLWLLAAPAYPLAIHLGLEQVPPKVYIHFIASLSLCGLIAAAYPFFGVAGLSMCSFYPALVRLESLTRDDLAGLVRLRRASWFYLLLAESVPMLAVAVLAVAGVQARYALGALAVGSLAGGVSAFLMFRLLQSDLGALITIATPPGETVDPGTETLGSFRA